MHQQPSCNHFTAPFAAFSSLHIAHWFKQHSGQQWFLGKNCFLVCLSLIEEPCISCLMAAAQTEGDQDEMSAPVCSWLF